MKSARTLGQVSRSLVLLLSWAACQAPTGPGRKGADATAPIYLKADGTVDYDALIADYGNPNENLILNPRALDIGATSSAATVQAHDGELVFPGPDGQWVTERLADDLLYCGTCGTDVRQTFLRKIVSISRVGADVHVKTVNAALNELVWWGWLHGDFGFDEDAPSAGLAPQTAPDQTLPLKTQVPGQQAPRNWGNHQETPQFSYQGSTWGIQVPTNLAGTLSLTPKNKGGVKIDMAFGWFSITLFRFEIIDAPSLTMLARVKVAVGGGYSHEPLPICDKEWAFGPWLMGPIPVDLVIQHKCFWTTNATGALELHAGANAGLNMDDGAVYTQQTGFKLIAANSIFAQPAPTCEAFNDGEIHTGPQEQVQANLMFFLVAGPSVGFTVFPNVWAKIEKGCGTAGFNVLLSGTVGVATESLKVGGRELIPSRDAQFQIPLVSYNYPPEGWKLGSNCSCVQNLAACTPTGNACCNATDSCSTAANHTGTVCCVANGLADPSPNRNGSQCCAQKDDGAGKCGPPVTGVDAGQADAGQDAGVVDGGVDAGTPDSGGNCVPSGATCSGNQSCCYAAAQCLSDTLSTVCCVPAGSAPDNGDITTCCNASGVGPSGNCL